MVHRLINSALIAAALLLSISLSAAADKKPEASAAMADAARPAATVSKPKEAAKKPAAAAKVKLVDINSAKPDELKTLPDIGDAEAGKIIAGRPYGSKSHLVTRNILAREVYEKLKKQVIAKQK